MSQDTDLLRSRQWARLRYCVVGPLLVSPPKPGRLQQQLYDLSIMKWKHPATGKEVQFAASTIERWYYIAKDKDDPIAALSRKIQVGAGSHPLIKPELAQAIKTLYREHPHWSYQLHYDNLCAMEKKDPMLGHVPSYPTVRRYMKDQGMLHQRRKKHRKKEGRDEFSPTRFESREKRSFEVTHVHALWHSDFHHGSRRVLLASGQWQTPILLGIIDDHSRLCCHLQWYLDETAETFIHGLCQAFQKRKLPRALLTDNGSAMTAAETEEGLLRLGIFHHTTLPYTPEQNAKQESFWGQVEGRLIAMLEGKDPLTLGFLNQATLAWVELEYNHRLHREIQEAPIERYLRDPQVGRESPGSEELRRAFSIQTSRIQRRSDGTISIEGVRFEVPSRYRCLLRPSIRYVRWDLSSVDLTDPRTGAHLCTLFPVDKTKNADGHRRILDHAEDLPEKTLAVPRDIAPHLRGLMETYAATGLPPAFLPKDDDLSPILKPQQQALYDQEKNQ